MVMLQVKLEFCYSQHTLMVMVAGRLKDYSHYWSNFSAVHSCILDQPGQLSHMASWAWPELGREEKLLKPP